MNDNPNRVVPYKTSTGLEIGKYYQRPLRVEISEYLEMIQSCLLNPHYRIRKPLPQTLKVICVFAIIACAYWVGR